MKCPECQNQHQAKLGQTCGRCGYQFVFNPKSIETPKMTDGKFLSYIKKASQDGTKYFTANQLYGVYCRSLNDSRWVGFLFGPLLLTIGTFIFFSDFNCGVVALWFFGGLILFSSFFPTKPLSPEQFDEYTQKFHTTGKPIEKLLNEPQLNDPPPDWPEPDIYDYGVERILIVERNLLVDLFVKNEVHTEQRMLVISENGYPQYLLPIAKKLLEERPDLPVFLLHDATYKGKTMKDRLLSSHLLPLENHPITDLGLSSDDFQKLKRTRKFDPANEQRTLPVDALTMPFLIGGLGTAFLTGTALSSLIEAQEEPNYSGGGSFDFG